MVLAIDVGNSNIVLGCMQGGKAVCICRIATEKHKTGDQYGLEIRSLLSMKGVGPEGFEGSIISSVVPSLTDSLSAAVRLAIGVSPIIVGPGTKTGLNIRMDNPAQVGADLVVESVGCINKYPLPVIIIDLGTATTIAVLNKKGEYVGGCIAPGVSLSLSALSSATAQLPDISLEAPKRAIGTNTVESMRSGVIFGVAALIDGMVERMEAELGEQANVVVTGGLATLVAPFCKRKLIVNEHLVLEGLYHLYLKNAAPPTGGKLER